MIDFIEQLAINFITGYPVLFFGGVILALTLTAFPEVTKGNFARLKKFFY